MNWIVWLCIDNIWDYGYLTHSSRKRLCKIWISFICFYIPVSKWMKNKRDGLRLFCRKLEGKKNFANNLTETRCIVKSDQIKCHLLSDYQRSNLCTVCVLNWISFIAKAKQNTQSSWHSMVEFCVFFSNRNTFAE